MKSKIITTILMPCLFLAAFYVFPSYAHGDDLKSRLTAQINQFQTKHSKGKNAKKPEISVSIIDVKSGASLFRYNADQALSAASITKLTTTYAVLKLLGVNYKFNTEIFADKTLHESAADDNIGDVGNLYIRGYGDPSLVNEILWDWTNSIKELGVTEVANIVIDDSLFIEPRKALGWESYNSGLSATSFNFNSYSFEISPTAAKKPALISVSPGLPMVIENHVTTGSKTKISMSYVPFPKTKQQPDSSGFTKLGTIGKLVFKGTIKEKGNPFVGYRSFPDDLTNYYGSAFAHFLKLNGIKVTGGVYKGTIPQKATRIHTFKSKLLADILSDLNKFSNNIIASQLIYAIGQDSNGYFYFDLGLKRLANVLQATGIEPGTYSIVDGSGLDRENKLSANHVSKVLLATARDQSIAPTFMNSLARFKDTGTLSKRSVFFNGRAKHRNNGMDKNRLKLIEESIWAKTGTLTGVSSLAGYLVNADKKRIIFTIIINGYIPKADMAAFEEDILSTIIQAE